MGKREIKFRAWNKTNNTMHPFINSIENWSFSFLNIDIFIWLQFTGLLDKNKTEIYEGDIVSIPLYGNVIIIWNKDVCSFQYAYHAIGKGSSIGGRITNTIYGDDTEVGYKVIGNIYENESLLTTHTPSIAGG